MEILVRREYSSHEVDLAELKRVEFRRNHYTSGSAHLDDLIALEKAIVLCDSHARKFKPRIARYELHPAHNCRRVQGNCDVCQMNGPATLFLHESAAIEARRNYERYRIASEYAHIVAQ